MRWKRLAGTTGSSPSGQFFTGRLPASARPTKSSRRPFCPLTSSIAHRCAIPARISGPWASRTPSIARRRFDEWGTPWPLIVFTRGEGKYTSRVWPFFSHAHNDTLTSRWYGWIVYKYNAFNSPPLERERTRILFFLYSDVSERSTETGAEHRRRDFWPLFTFRKDLNGNTRLQVLAVLEPILPNNKSIERNYSPLWSIWRLGEERRARARTASPCCGTFTGGTPRRSRKNARSSSDFFSINPRLMAGAGACFTFRSEAASAATDAAAPRK